MLYTILLVIACFALFRVLALLFFQEVARQKLIAERARKYNQEFLQKNAKKSLFESALKEFADSLDSDETRFLETCLLEDPRFERICKDRKVSFDPVFAIEISVIDFSGSMTKTGQKKPSMQEVISAMIGDFNEQLRLFRMRKELVSHFHSKIPIPMEMYCGVLPAAEVWGKVITSHISICQH